MHCAQQVSALSDAVCVRHNALQPELRLFLTLETCPGERTCVLTCAQYLLSIGAAHNMSHVCASNTAWSG